MILRRFTALLLFFCVIATGLAVPASAQTASGPKKIVSTGGVTEYRLENGLRVLLVPDQTRQNITVNIVYHVGSRHEGYGETGMAHLLEHLVFKGTPKYQNIPAEMTKRGMAPNGTTSFDRTNYFATFPATGDNLEFYLDMEADRMINSYIARKDLDSEFSVVRNEMESGENNATRVLLQKVMASAYQWHNYGKSTIGARADVENVKIENLQAFYRKFYQPDNATLIVGGKFEEAATLKMIQEKFGGIPKPTRVLEPTWTVDPPQDGERTVTVRRVGADQWVMLGYHIPPAASADSAAISYLERLLVDSPSGRLYKALVDNKKAVSVLSGNFQQKEPGYFLVGARLNSQQSVDEAEKAMIETVENFAATPPTKEEIDRYRATFERQYDTLMNDANTVAQMLTDWVARGDWRLLFLYRERLRTVTPEDVQRVARSYLLSSNRTVGRFIPEDKSVRTSIKRLTDEEITAIANQTKTIEKTAEGEVFDPTPANIEARVKRGKIGGIKTAFLSKDTRGDVVTLRLSLNFGDEKSLRNRSAAAEVAGGLLDIGTVRRNEQQLKDDLNKIKSTVNANGGLTGAGLTITSTRENLAAALRIGAEIIREPLFSQADFDKAKAAAIANLENQRTDPTAIASRAMRLAFNTDKKGDVRYVPTIDEELADLKAVTLDDVRKFHKDFYGASNAELSIVGDFDEKEISTVVGELFGNWKSPKAYKRVPQLYKEFPAVKNSFETPDKANAVFFARLNLKMNDAHPDYPAMLMANFIFGGGFLNSRLATRLRQKDGLSYSVASGFGAGSVDEFGAFTAQAIYAPENGEKLKAAFYDELQKVITDGYTETELKEAKQGWILGRKRNRGNDAGLRSTLAVYLSLDRTLAWDQELENRIDALTLDQVNAAFRKYIDPAKVSIFMAGDFAKSKAAK